MTASGPLCERTAHSGALHQLGGRCGDVDSRPGSPACAVSPGGNRSAIQALGQRAFWHHPAVNRQIIYKPKSEHRGAAGFMKLVGEIRAERFDAAFLFPNAFQAAWMAWLARIPLRIGYAREYRGFLLGDAVEVSPARRLRPSGQLLPATPVSRRHDRQAAARRRNQASPHRSGKKLGRRKRWMRWDWTARDSS